MARGVDITFRRGRQREVPAEVLERLGLDGISVRLVGLPSTARMGKTPLL